MNFVFPPPATVSVPVVGTQDRFPVHRIYCVGRNYEEHAKEMGFTGREPPFFFLKPADAMQHIFGYAVGLDMTRRDLQGDMKKAGRPWCIGKAFDHSAPIGPITPAAQAGDIVNAELSVQVNGADRQRSNVSKLIWNMAETIEHLSAAWELQPGDLIYTGTPEGVGAVVVGDTMVGAVAGLQSITVKVA